MIFGKSPNILNLEGFTGPVYAIGDIHGRLDLLLGLEAKILADAAGFAGKKLIIWLGDAIDRGPDSFGVLTHALKPLPNGLRRICLQGNHEDMMLKFLQNPAKNSGWLEVGGRETLVSYGATLQDTFAIPPQSRKMRFLLERVMPKAHLAFLQHLPHAITLKPFFLSHAGGNPKKPLAKQSIQNLVWGKKGFMETGVLAKRRFVHGHFPVKAAAQENGKISIDTGAYTSGKLSAARLGPEGAVRFMTFGTGSETAGNRAKPFLLYKQAVENYSAIESAGQEF